MARTIKQLRESIETLKAKLSDLQQREKSATARAAELSVQRCGFLRLSLDDDSAAQPKLRRVTEEAQKTVQESTDLRDAIGLCEKEIAARENELQAAEKFEAIEQLCKLIAERRTAGEKIRLEAAKFAQLVAQTSELDERLKDRLVEFDLRFPNTAHLAKIGETGLSILPSPIRSLADDMVNSRTAEIHASRCLADCGFGGGEKGEVAWDTRHLKCVLDQLSVEQGGACAAGIRFEEQKEPASK